ncbi:tripartite motif-containing protein 75-like isoform X2 [Liolophura sinensis]|uniref:tripartite motif-containing protein 75-like isoform X2 n=1 Tax=Liolophura sinensis TaxID=3198878 RepID=UPI00315987A0
MDLPDLPLLVPISAFSDYIQCSICMTLLNNTHTTPCGHRYCEKCIKEWVDRQHKCPCCNHPLQNNQLMKDHQFDGLIACVLQEQDKSETQYFESLISKATSTTANETFSLQTPVENVLKKHLLSSLAAHEKFCQELKKEFISRTQKLEEGMKRTISELAQHGLSEEELQSQTEDLLKTLKRQKDGLSKDLESCVQLVATAYDKHLSNHIPTVDILPVKVSVFLLEKDVRLDNIQLKPTDSLSDIQEIVELSLAERNDPIVSMGDDVQWLVFGPFAKGSNWEMQAVAQDIIEHGNTNHPGVCVIQDKTMISVQYCIKPNSDLVVWGNVKCKSDLPKLCFVKLFSPGEQKSVDYFSCKQCGFNWVCRSCMEICHQGHNVVPYIMNHQPTWACCYCPKKKTCIIQDVK